MLPFYCKVRVTVYVSVALLIALSVLSSSSHAAVLDDYIYKLVEEGKYEEALPWLRDYGLRIDCGDECRGEVFFLSGFCRYNLGQTDYALAELTESVMLRPRFTISEDDYPRQFVELYQRARDKVLCSVEIRVVSPRTLALRFGNQLSTVFRAVGVSANWIELRSNRYSRAQRYRLLPGQMNTFELELEELRDYHAFDSLHLSLRPTFKKGTRDMWTEDSEQVASPHVDIGRHSVELMESNYYPGELTNIVLEGEGAALTVTVLRARMEWSKLHKDLASNPNRRILARILKVGGLAGFVVTTAWALKADSDAEDKYESYLVQYDALEISRTYREHRDLIAKRNRLGAFAIGFAATSILSYLFSPGNERDLVEEYERKYRGSGVSLEVRGDYIGLRAALNL